MGQLFQLILDNLKALWPVRIVEPDEGGVRFTLGKAESPALPPGWYFFCPGVQRITTWSVVYQEVDCQLQSMETADGVSVTFDMNVGYSVDDLVKMLTRVENFDATLERACRRYLAEIINESDYEDIRTDLPTTAITVMESIQDFVKDWGVKIETAGITNFTRAKPYRWLGASPQF